MGDGFDLDLTYVTPRIIAMGIPSVDYQKVYRNRIEDVERFLETRHSTNYKVYNLCSEMRNTYAMTRFGGRFERFPFDDHSPPPLGLLYYFCESAHEWLSSHKEHVIAVHCKAGKGRTGTCISAYFLYARLYRTPAEAMAAYGSARTKNRKGVTIPSQRRFVEYFGHCCERRHVVDLDSVYTTHRFRDEDLGGRGWGMTCAPYEKSAPHGGGPCVHQGQEEGLWVLVPLFVCRGLYLTYYEGGAGQGLEGQGLPRRRRGRINVWAAHDKISIMSVKK